MFKPNVIALLGAAVLCASFLASSTARATPTERVLYRFTGGADGGHPYAGLIKDGSGNLFGTTSDDGSGYGTVFELVNGGSSYTLSTLYSFSGGGDGGQPHAGLILDSSGNLYGTTSIGGSIANAGAVFELVKSGSSYTLSTLHAFSGPDGATPDAGLIM